MRASESMEPPADPPPSAAVLAHTAKEVWDGGILRPILENTTEDDSATMGHIAILANRDRAMTVSEIGCFVHGRYRMAASRCLSDLPADAGWVIFVYGPGRRGLGADDDHRDSHPSSTG